MVDDQEMSATETEDRAETLRRHLRTCAAQRDALAVLIAESAAAGHPISERRLAKFRKANDDVTHWQDKWLHHIKTKG